MKVRRVITGHNAKGEATFVSDTDVDGITFETIPGLEFHRLWGSDNTMTFPDDGSPPPQPSYYPPVGGFRFGFFTIAPGSVETSENFDLEAALKELEEKAPGMAEHMELDNPGMHTTDTIDFAYIISGEAWLELDNGAEVCLKAGDTIVQNGTRHAWRNKTSEPCVIVTCLIGARRR